MSPVVTICTTSLTFNNSTFCPHTVFVCFVRIWEETAIISLHNNNWLVFITETESGYRGVRAEYLNRTNYVLSLKASILEGLVNFTPRTLYPKVSEPEEKFWRKKKECFPLAGIRSPDRAARSFVTILSYPDPCSVESKNAVNCYVCVASRVDECSRSMEHWWNDTDGR